MKHRTVAILTSKLGATPPQCLGKGRRGALQGKGWQPSIQPAAAGPPADLTASRLIHAPDAHGPQPVRAMHLRDVACCRMQGIRQVRNCSPLGLPVCMAPLHGSNALPLRPEARKGHLGAYHHRDPAPQITQALVPLPPGRYLPKPALGLTSRAVAALGRRHRGSARSTRPGSLLTTIASRFHATEPGGFWLLLKSGIAAMPLSRCHQADQRVIKCVLPSHAAWWGPTGTANRFPHCARLDSSAAGTKLSGRFIPRS